MRFPKSSERGEAGEAGEPSLQRGDEAVWPQGCGTGEAAAGRRATFHLHYRWGATSGPVSSRGEAGSPSLEEKDTHGKSTSGITPASISLFPGRRPRTSSHLEPQTPQGEISEGFLCLLMRKQTTVFPLVTALC